MNLDLQLKDHISSVLPGRAGSYTTDRDMGRIIPTFELPNLEQVLNGIGPLPGEALFMGLADDGGPVMLNLWDSLAGRVLIAGDRQSGKTRFLRTLTCSAAATHTDSEVQYGVITNRPHEWDGYASDRYCIGIFPTTQKSTVDFIRALAMWTNRKHVNLQSILLLIDDLNEFLRWNSDLTCELQKILTLGTEKRILTFATLNLEQNQVANLWLEHFRTRIFGFTKQGRLPDDINFNPGFDGLSKGSEFCYREQSHWVKFMIPRI